MSLDAAAAIGQLVWPVVRASRGERTLRALRPFWQRFGAGGIILFGEGEPGVEGLIAQLRLAAPGDLLVSSDLERGCGQQVRELTCLPPAMALAACPWPEAAYEAGLLTGLEARSVGIDVVYAPVADVNTAASNPIIATRSFGDDPVRVSALASAFAKGLADGGVLAVGKHFPGHGSTVQDSHEELARITRDADAMDAIDLPPFRTLIAEDIGGLMVGHLEVPALDPVPGRPATASPNVVLDHLRHRLGYDGLLVTDALDMGGFRQEPAAGIDVLHAGLDVLLMPADALATAEALLAAYERRELADEVLAAAVRRVATARRRVREFAGATHRIRPGLAERLQADSLTTNGLPLPGLASGESIDLTVFGEDDSGMVVPAFLEALHAHGVGPGVGGRPVALVLTSVRAWAHSARLDPQHRKRLHWGVEHGKFELVIVLGSPYEMLELPPGTPVLLAYEATPTAAQAAALVSLGRARAPGRLPVGSEVVP